MMFQDYEALARLTRQETERQARHAWKFYEQQETKAFPIKNGPCCIPSPRTQNGGVFK
jgi:hypothetical protein